ncbi:hypothetical protein C3496_12325 [Bacillus anthracis]|uniref:hypothetical protein n=1 Tax=Bacillus TaxID=1386 RepID=UPI0010A616E7|nr:MULTISPECIES: hypothetical protein [Bacillus]QBJ67108.1 hypothetical protein C3496_12325 [Bacillus anthracis]THG62625.1 hypothetical protein E7Y01_02380 [Bacillus sp. HUB-I-004]
MPVWLLTQICLFCFWFMIGIYIYYTKLWKANFLVSKKYYFLFTFVLLVPSLASLSSIVFGLIYLLNIYQGISFSQPVFFLLVAPGTYLIILLLYILIQYTFSFRKEKQQYYSKQEVQKACFKWLKQFDFLNEDMYNIKVYLVEGEVEGRIKIRDLTSEQLVLINKAQDSLPDNIYLYLVPKRI